MHVRWPRWMIRAVLCFLVVAVPAVVVQATGLLFLGINANQSFEFTDVQRTITDPRNTAFMHYRSNPIIPGTNLYAPSLLKLDGTWYAYYGGYLADSDIGNDSVYLSTTTDDTMTTGWSAPARMVDHGFYVHANDASVVKRGATWYMALTTYKDYDWCSLLTSTNGTSWPTLTGRNYEVHFNDPAITTCARPSLIRNEAANRWEMYFDSIMNGVQRQYVAFSTEATPINFTLQQQVGDMVDADIKRLPNGLYISAFRPSGEPLPWRIHLATSADGRSFTEQGVILEQDPLNSYDDQGGVTNGGWAIDGNIIKALLFGGTTPGIDKHKVGIAFPQMLVTAQSGSVSHVIRQALGPNRQRVETFSYTTISQLQAQDVPNGALVLDQAVNAGRGSVFSIRGRSFTNAPRASAFASSSLSSLPAAAAIDGSASSFWSSTQQSSSAASEWLAVDMGTAQTLTRVAIVPRGSGYGFPSDFKLQASDDGTTWNDIPGQSYTGFANPGSAEVDLVLNRALTTRYVRLFASKLGVDNYNNIYFQLAELLPQTSDTPRTNAFASSTTASFSAAQAIDGTTSFWSSAQHSSSAATEWIAVDAGASMAMKGITLQPRQNGYGFPTDFTVQSSSDGATWTDVPGQSYSDTANPGDTTRTLVFNAEVNARYLRVVATKLGADNFGNFYFQLVELNPQF